jgi:hypothetical protein
VDCSTTVLQVIEARCDWITATGSKDGKASDLADVAIGNVNGERECGYEQKPWKFQGYYGFQCGEWAWGWGEHGAIVCVSGGQAEVAARTLARSSDHWSRCDYCVTAVDATDTLRPDVEYWANLRKLQRVDGYRTAFTRIQASDNGATFSLGSRTAAVYCRTYNKHVESEGRYQLGAWRWEVELKRHRSEAEQRRQIEGNRTTAEVLALVQTEYQTRRLSVPWRVSTAVESDRCPPREPTMEKTLKWFEVCVKPAIERAVATVGRQRVRDILQL